MGQLSIKIKIGNREYPMKVAAEEEAAVRQAGKILNDRLKYYHEQFGIDDKQDLLAMVAFDSVIERFKSEHSVKADSQKLLDKISHINQLISQAS